MGEKKAQRNEDQLLQGVAMANRLVSDLSSRDGVDTASYGLMVRRAGTKSLALHRGLHPSEQAPDAASGSRDPRLPRAQVGLSLSGALKTDLREEIARRHDELVRLHRWSASTAGRPRTAVDFRWDPVLLRLLGIHGVDLDALVASGPGEFANPAGRSDSPGVPIEVVGASDDGTPYLGCVDGDAVRALRIRYAPGVVYRWRRDQPDHVDLVAKDRTLPATVTNGLLGCRFSVVVDHPSLDAIEIESCTSMPGVLSCKAARRLVSP
jgi:hypothetical protein